jgi:hypothetical protein
MSQEEWDARSEELRERGLGVTLHFPDPPEEPEWYQPRLEAEWVNDEHHEGGGYWYESEAPVLFVGLEPKRGVPRLSNRPRRHGEVYRIPLCRTTELHRFDLRDAVRGVRLGLEAYRRLKVRYEGRAAVLRGRMEGGAFRLSRASEVEGTRSNLISDEDFRMLQSAGLEHDQEPHVSM